MNRFLIWFGIFAKKFCLTKTIAKLFSLRKIGKAKTRCLIRNKSRSFTPHVAKIAEKLLNSCSNNSQGNERLCQLLQSRDYYGNHLLKEFTHDEIRMLFPVESQQLMESLETKVSSENIEVLNELMLEFTSQSRNEKRVLKIIEGQVLYNPTLHLAFNFGSHFLIDKLLTFMGNLDKLVVERLLAIKGLKNRNILFPCLWNRTQQENTDSTASELWKFIITNLSDERILSLLNEPDDCVRTICFWAIMTNDLVAIDILEWLRDKFKPEDKFMEQYLKQNRLSSSLGHYFTGKSNDMMCGKFFDFLTNSFSHSIEGNEMVEEIILLKNDVDEIPLQYFLHNKDASAASTIFKFYQNNLSREKFEKILRDINFSNYCNSRKRISASVEALKKLSIEYFQQKL